MLLAQDKLNNLLQKLRDIKADVNTEWFRNYPYDADLRVMYANELESRLTVMFNDCFDQKRTVEREDFFLLYLGWLSFISADKGLALEDFEQQFEIDVAEKCKNFSEYAYNSQETNKFNLYITKGSEEEKREDIQPEEEHQEHLKDLLEEDDSENSYDGLSLADLTFLVAVAIRCRDMARDETDMIGNEMLHNVARHMYKYHTWNSMEDSRVRKDHAIADKQTKPIDEPFTVGGSLLLYPGDTSLGASLRQIVNCRCFETFSGKSNINQADR